MPAILEKVKEDKLDLLNDLIKEEVKIKQCTQCKEIKYIDNFNNDCKRKDGLHPYCRECANENTLASYHRNKLKIKEKNKLKRVTILSNPVKIYNKKCIKCNSLKNVNEFTKNISHKDGISSICKICSNEKNRQYKQAYYVNNRNIITLDLQSQCVVCKENKNSYEFKINRSNKNGINSICKKCKPYPPRSKADKNKASREKLRNLLKKENILNKWVILSNNKCINCNRNFANYTDLKRTKYYTIDHWIPLSKGGTHNVDNLLLLCNSCNSSKFTKLPEEFFGEHYERINNERLRIISELNISNEIKELIENVGK